MSIAPRGAVESDLVLVQNVSKLYRLYRRPSDRLRELLPGSRPLHSDFWALRDINFEVAKGETLSLVDRAYLIHGGTVMIQGKPEVIMADPDARRVYLGDSFSM